MNSLLEKYLDENREEIIEKLSELVAIPSVSENEAEVKKALQYVLSLGGELGFESHNLLDGRVGTIEMGDGEETLGILAHVDVVSAGDVQEWDTPPFEATARDGKIFGRGTLDDKGMIIAALYAMKSVAVLGQPLKKKVRLILGTQEEVEWTDMNEYVKKYELPDYGFTPDGEYPICNIEKGNGDIMMEFDAGDRPKDGIYIEEVKAGVAKNAVPGRAAATLSSGEVIVATGKQVHSCQPERGVNAIFELQGELSKRKLTNNNLLTLLNEVKKVFEDIFGESLGLASESEYYDGEFVHRNAFSPTILKTEDGKTKLNINIRFAYGADFDEILKKIKEWAESLGGRVTEVNSTPAVFVSKEKPFLGALAEAYEEVSGLKNEYTLAYGGSYAKAMPNVVSWAPIFPGEEDTCHEPNEYIGIDSLMTSAKIFAEAISRIALTEKSFK